MTLRGLRFLGVAGTIFAYVIGIFLLSLISVQNPQQRRPRTRIYGEVDPFQTRVLGLLGKRQPLQWCRELRYMGQDPIKTLDKPKVRPKRMQTFPGHFVHIKNDRIENQLVNSLHKDTNTIHNSQNASKKSSTLTTVTTLSSLPSSLGGGVPARRGLTALASFPGSGNTWLRYLLQQSTGIYTGSVYKDYGLLKSGFPAENVYNSSVLVVKTHEWGQKAWFKFSKCILLVRDPEKAIQAEFNRQSGGHVGFASPDRYKRAKGRFWQQFVTNHLSGWEQMNLAWTKDFPGDVKIVFYDDLVENVEKILREILHFIKFPIDEDLLSCAIIRRDGIYQRKKRLMTFDPYSPPMRTMVQEKRDDVYAQLGRVRTNTAQNNNINNNLIDSNNNKNDNSNRHIKNNLDDNTKT